MEKENQNKKLPNDKPKKEEKPIELSEEDKEYKKNIDDMVDALLDADLQIQQNAFNMIKNEIVTSTGSMTSIPRPLKFFRAHYDRIKEHYTNEQVKEKKHLLGNILSVLILCTTTTDTSLQYILDNDIKNFDEWGQEFIRSLAGEVGTEFVNRLDNDKPIEDLKLIVSYIVPFLIKTNNESEALDLLLEMDLRDEIKNYCKPTNYKKICLYLIASSNYAADSDEQREILEIVYELYTKFNEPVNALRIAIKMNETNYIKSTFLGCESRKTQLQMAFILAKEKIFLDDLDQELTQVISNLKLSEIFKKVGRSLEIMEPKHPEEIFKSHLEDKKSDNKPESSKANLSSSIASSFINAGFCSESLLSKKETDWLSKNKDEGLICSLGGLGLVNIWDVDCGPNEIEKFMDQNEMNPFKRGGYNLGLGIICSGIREENHTAMAILLEQISDKKYLFFT